MRETHSRARKFSEENLSQKSRLPASQNLSNRDDGQVIRLVWNLMESIGYTKATSRFDGSLPSIMGLSCNSIKNKLYPCLNIPVYTIPGCHLASQRLWMHYSYVICIIIEVQIPFPCIYYRTQFVIASDFIIGTFSAQHIQIILL